MTQACKGGGAVTRILPEDYIEVATLCYPIPLWLQNFLRALKPEPDALTVPLS